MAVIDWFAANRVAANLLMALVALAGLLYLPGLRQESFPNVPFDMVSITIELPAAAPDEVEEAICVPVEEAIAGVEGIRRVRSRSVEGLGSITAELRRGVDRRRVVEEIESRLAALRGMPDRARPPVVQELIDDNVVLSVAIYGDVAEQTLRSVGERVRDEITDLAEITRAELAGIRPPELAIEVSELELQRYGLRFDDVVAAVRSSSLDLAGGLVRTPGAEYLLRTRGRALRRPDFESLVLLTREDGTRLSLGAVAQISDGFAENGVRVRFDGKPALLVTVLERENRQVLEVSRAVGRWLEGARARMPEGIELAIWNDEAAPLESRRTLLLRNAAMGLALVLLVLALLLPARLAFWVSAGIPVAFLGAVIAMASFDVSINMMSLFAFVVALGLVVDDAIVIGERVAHHQQRDPTASALDCAIRGAREVAVPVVVAVLTTALFLAPALSAPTFYGKLARPVPIVVIACLLFSLMEALLVLPAHLSHPSKRRATGASSGRCVRLLANARSRASSGLEFARQRTFAPALELALRSPLLIVSLSCVGLMLSVAGVAGGWVRFSLLPEVEADLVTAELEMPAGTPPEVTWGHLRRIEAAALALEAAPRGGEKHGAAPASRRTPVIRHLLSAVGGVPDEHDDWKRGGNGGHTGLVRIQLAPGEGRALSSLEIEERWRRSVGEVSGAVSLRFSGADIGDDPPIELQLASRDRGELIRATQTLERRLAAYPGVREIDSSLRAGRRELDLHIRPEGEALGLSLAELARQVRQGFHGEEVQRIQRGRHDIPVVVRYPVRERRSLSNLDDVRIRTPAGDALPFAAVASLSLGRGYASGEREAGRRTVNVSADVDRSVTSPDEILADLEQVALPVLAREHPGVEVRKAGQGRDEAELFAGLLRAWALALVAAYVLLAAPLRSYVEPLLILLVVPFGFVGAVAGHALLGIDLSAFSLIGLVALCGVVINDALVLTDAARRQRELGRSVSEALREAAHSRFRPIVLTSLTTFIGLLPLLFERSAQADWLKPMAVTLAVGVLFATPVTLLLLPAMQTLVSRARVVVVAVTRTGVV